MGEVLVGGARRREVDIVAVVDGGTSIVGGFQCMPGGSWVYGCSFWMELHMKVKQAVSAGSGVTSDPRHKACQAPPFSSLNKQHKSSHCPSPLLR